MNLVERAKNIIISPKTEWEVIANEEPNAKQILFSYVLPLAFIPAIASVFGSIIFNPFGFGFGLAIGIGMAIIYLIISATSIMASAFIVDALAPNFGSQKNYGRSVQLIAYSITPMFVLGILNIIFFIGWLFMLVGIGYGIYIMYLGLGNIMKTPEDKKVGYLIVSMISFLFVFWVFYWILYLIIVTGIITAIFGFGMMTGFN